MDSKWRSEKNMQKNQISKIPQSIKAIPNNLQKTREEV